MSTGVWYEAETTISMCGEEDCMWRTALETTTLPGARVLEGGGVGWGETTTRRDWGARGEGGGSTALSGGTL